MARRFTYLAAAFVLAALGLMAGAPAAWAHATLVAASPADGAIVAHAPATVSATFDEPVGVSPDSLQVLAPSGSRVDTGGTAHGSKPQEITVEIYRVGAYEDHRTALLGRSVPVAVTPQPEPVTDPETGMVSCLWEAAWRLNVPADWKSGAYLAVLRADTGANYVPFVVRDLRRRAGQHHPAHDAVGVGA